MEDTNWKAREARLRRSARRQGFLLLKSRCRTYEAEDYGTFLVLDDRNVVEFRGLIDEVERYLAQ